MARASDPSAKRAPRIVRLPVFVGDEPVGLGDVIKRATSAVGIKPCAGCAERAEQLNRRVALTGPVRRSSERSM
jgi:hypothetical protein